MPVALFAINSYVAAEAYAQARSLALPSSGFLPAPPTEGRSFPPSVFFAAGASSYQPSNGAPYRSSLLVRFPQATLPQDIVDYLINRSYLTGRYFSLFRHGPASAPKHYEVREGSPTECDRSLLGGEAYDALEEAFFDTAWVAHVHPPHRSSLPSDADLDAIAERAQLRATRHARHVLFGFFQDEPVSVDMRALWDPIFRGVAVLHRASPAIAGAADERIQEWLGKK